MAVTFDAKTATWTNVNGVSPLTISNLTVGIGTNRALSVMVMCSITAGALPPGLTAIWDSGGTNQACTQVAGTVIADPGPPCGAAMYGLIAPTSGNKSLVLAWTGGGSFEVHACAISFTGVDQTSVAVAFPHGAHNNANGASPTTVTITSAAGNMVVACHAQNFSPYGVVSGTTLAKDDVTGPNLGVVSNYDNGAATVAMTAAFTGTGPWSSIGCDVLAAGGAASNPFIAVDFPNPRGPQLTLDARSFINRTQTQLIGKDKFFGAAGQTETYDWPNPRGPAFPIDLRTFVNPTETQLIGKDRFFRGPGQSPVYDYPNPQPLRYPSDNRTFLNPTKTQLIGKDTFFRGPGQSPVYDWPNPVGRKALASDQPTSLLTTLLSVLLVAPFFQGDWPNPPRLRRPPMHEHSPNFLTALYTVLIPISAWFHNPWPALFPITARTHLNQTQTQLIGKDQFFAAPGQPPTYDWINPIRPKQQMPETPPNLLATLLSILAFPFTQLSWPNPFARLFGDRTHLNAVQTQLIGQDQFFGAAGQPPVFDWSNPVNRKTAAPPEPTPNLLSTLLSILAFPFAQLSWPNPAARRDRTTHLNAVQTQLIGQDQFFGAPGQVPTYTWNIPVPRKDDVTQRSWLVNLLQSTLSLPIFAPFAFLGWTVPLGARPNQPAPQQPPNIVINTAPAPPSTDTPWSGFVANLGRMMIRRG